MPNHTSFVVTSGPTSVNAVRDDNGTLPGYEIAYTATVTYANGSTGDVAGYRFFRQISDQGVTLEIFLECAPAAFPPPTHGISSCSRHEWRDSMLGPWDR